MKSENEMRAWWPEARGASGGEGEASDLPTGAPHIPSSWGPNKPTPLTQERSDFSWAMGTFTSLISFHIEGVTRSTEEQGTISCQLTADCLSEKTWGRLSLKQAVEAGLKVQACSDAIFLVRKEVHTYHQTVVKKRKRKTNVNYYMFLWG